MSREQVITHLKQYKPDDLLWTTMPVWALRVELEKCKNESKKVHPKNNDTMSRLFGRSHEED
jgi:hypothetical protein